MRFGVKLITNHHNSLLTFYARLSDFSGHELDWNKFWIQPSLSDLCALKERWEIFSYSAIENCLSIAEEVGWQESSPSSCDRRRNGGCCQKGENHLILVAVNDQIVSSCSFDKLFWLPSIFSRSHPDHLRLGLLRSWGVLHSLGRGWMRSWFHQKNAFLRYYGLSIWYVMRDRRGHRVNINILSYNILYV